MVTNRTVYYCHPKISETFCTTLVCINFYIFFYLRVQSYLVTSSISSSKVNRLLIASRNIGQNSNDILLFYIFSMLSLDKNNKKTTIKQKKMHSSLFRYS
uniref:Uncharacterized protein n=1 Tax=Octopus bimaculoides TaxID=37653 RepID=A0A0L8I4W6_OCTBM